MIGAICIAISGFAVLITVHDNLSVQYGALFLVVMGTYSAMPVQVCWFNMNLAGHHRRAIGSAWQIGMSPPSPLIPHFTRQIVLTTATRFWQHRRHHLHLLVRLHRCSLLQEGLRHLRVVYLPQRAGLGRVCRRDYLGEQEAREDATESRFDGAGEDGFGGYES